MVWLADELLGKLVLVIKASSLSQVDSPTVGKAPAGCCWLIVANGEESTSNK